MEINYYLLEKFGWQKYLGYGWSSPSLTNIFTKIQTENSKVLRYLQQDNTIFCLVGFFENEKQSKKEQYNRYQFCILKNSKNKPLISSQQDVYSNQELFSLIKLNLACNKTYKRLFQINSIIK